MTDNDRVVCTHTIFAELCEVMPELAIAIVNDKNGHLFDLDLLKYGLFTCTDWMKMAQTLGPRKLG